MYCVVICECVAVWWSVAVCEYVAVRECVTPVAHKSARIRSYCEYMCGRMLQCVKSVAVCECVAVCGCVAVC